MSDHILHGHVNGVTTITLNRPDRLNAFTKPMLEDLLDLVKAAAADDAVRCIVLTGAGRGFCAGQDLSDRSVAPSEDAPDLGESLENRYNPLVRLMYTIDKPVVVAVNGVAAGAGANVALAGDVVIAARSARFVESFAKLGLIPDAGGSYVLPRTIGMARAKGMAMLGEPITAEQAEAWGLIWMCVDDDQLTEASQTIAATLADGPTNGLAKIKRVLNASLANSLNEQLNLERDVQRSSGRGAEYQEGVAAFMEKRQPNFRNV